MPRRRRLLPDFIKPRKPTLKELDAKLDALRKSLGSLEIREPKPRTDAPRLRTLALSESGAWRYRRQASQWLSAVRVIDPSITTPRLIPALLDHEATRGLSSFIPIPSFPVAPPPPPLPGHAHPFQVTLTPGFLAPTKPLISNRSHIPDVPSHFMAHLVALAPECLQVSQTSQEWPSPAWHNFSRSGRCALVAHCELGSIPIAKAPCAGRLIQVAYALSQAKCGLKLFIPRSSKPPKNPYDRHHPITSLTVENV